MKNDHSRMKDMSSEELEQWLDRLRMANRCCSDDPSFSQNYKDAQQQSQRSETQTPEEKAETQKEKG